MSLLSRKSQDFCPASSSVALRSTSTPRSTWGIEVGPACSGRVFLGLDATCRATGGQKVTLAWRSHLSGPSQSPPGPTPPTSEAQSGSTEGQGPRSPQTRGASAVLLHSKHRQQSALHPPASLGPRSPQTRSQPENRPPRISVQMQEETGDPPLLLTCNLKLPCGNYHLRRAIIPAVIMV